MSTRCKQLLIFMASLLVLLSFFYWPWLFGGRNFFFKDTTHFFEPLCRFIGDGIRHQHLPLWNPYSYCGMSQAAISSPSIFFPLNWLFGFLPFSVALAVIMVLSQLVCAVGMFLLIESLGWGLLPSLIAAGAVSLSGYMFSLSSNYTLVATAAWIPLILYFSRRYLQTGSVWWLLGNAGAVAMLIGAGRPELSGPALLMVAALGALGAAGAVDCPPASEVRLHMDIGFFKSLIIGVLLAMPVVLPALEWIPISRRAQGLQPFEILLYSANWYQLLSMFVIEPLDNFQLRNSQFGALISGVDMVPYFDSAFVGTIVLALALIGLCKRGRLFYWSTVAMLVLSVVLALGHNIPYMTQIVGYVPGAAFLRFPSKLLFFTVLAIGLLAARGAMLYLRAQVNLIPHIIGWLLAVVGCVVLFCSTVILLPLTAGSDHSLAETAQTIVALRVGSQAALALAALLALYIGQRLSRSTPVLGAVTGVAVLSMLVNAVASCSFSAPENYFSQPSLLLSKLHLPVGADAGERTTPLMFERFTAPPWVESSDRLASTINDFQYTRQVFKAFTNIDYRLPSQFGFEGSMVGEYHYFFLNSYVKSSQSLGRDEGQTVDDLPLFRLLQAGSTRYVLTQVKRQFGRHPAEDVPALDRRYFERILRDPSFNVQVYKLKDTLPRAYLAAACRQFDTRDELLEYMSSCRKTGWDPARETLIYARADAPSEQTATITPVKIQSEQPESLTMQVNAPQSALLVLQDQEYPGWYADIDGKAVELLRCNGFMRSVIVPAGGHTVHFYFRPKSLLASFAIALLAFLWCVSLVFEARRQKQAAAKDEP